MNYGVYYEYSVEGWGGRFTGRACVIPSGRIPLQCDGYKWETWRFLKFDTYDKAVESAKTGQGGISQRNKIEIVKVAWY